MSYGDARQNRTLTIGAVVIVHAALGYALLTGLATDVVRVVVHGPTLIYDVDEVPPPPPGPVVQPKPDKVLPRTAETLAAPLREVTTPTNDALVVTSIDLPPGPIVDALPGPAAEPAQPLFVSLARGVRPRGNQGDWFPSDSYPSAARRANAEGLVSVRVTVGTDGRVSDCSVTASSGNAELDSATCRLARRNGRFEPARDPNGTPLPSTFSLRNVRWRLTD